MSVLSVQKRFTTTRLPPGGEKSNLRSDRPWTFMLLPFIIAIHVLTAVAAPPLVRFMGSRAFLVASLPLALAAVWGLVQAPDIVGGRPPTASIPWVPALGITFDFRVDALSLAMMLLVCGVGAVIFCYSAAYFQAGERVLGRLAAVLVLFAGAMLGVVTTDNLFALYVFWELTSVTSFLLIAHSDQRESARRAAVQALVTTVGFGLLMLVGFLLLGSIGGTYRISELVADPPVHDPWLSTALVLILAGAFAKSAQVPLHYWLPSAMAAPTPVSAYLHAATMVKGGVYLIARLAPGFVDAVGPWRVLVLTFGLATMILGGWRALRQDDLKLLLAYGTISQLGMLTVLAGAGTHTAAVAAISLLLAHGLFKAALFLVVGIIDHQSGTRSISRLTGVGRRLPVTAAAAGLAASSMAGLPPLLGFVSKEASLEAFLPGQAPALTDSTATVVLTALVAGSILTFAYSARFLWGAFADKDTVSAIPFPRPSRAFTAAPVILAGAGLVSGVLPFTVDPIAQAYATPLATGTEPLYHLALWHGLNPALGLSALVVAVGVLLFWQRRAMTRFQNATPNWYEAEAGYDAVLEGIRWTAFHVTSRAQSGSLPVYLGIILATMLVLPGTRLLAALISGDAPMPSAGDGFRLWDNPLEIIVVLLVTVTAVATVREHRRFPALILISALGFGIAGLFVLYGAPDLALTLVLVETLTTIILVFVLRRLPATFKTRPGSWPKRLTVLMCAALGTFIAVALWVMAHSRTNPSVSHEYEAYAEQAGGRNLVNIILVDFRALDTFGEIVVLVTAAIAVSSLVLLNRRDRIAREFEESAEESTEESAAEEAAQESPQNAGPGSLGTVSETASAAGLPDSAQPEDRGRDGGQGD